MKNRKPQLFTVFAMLLAVSMQLALSAVVLAADSYPSKPVHLIVLLAPGGANDIVGRALATLLTKNLGTQVVVENIAGGGGIVGTERVAKADPDGYTLLLISANHCLGPALKRSLPYDPVKSFVPIANIATGPMVLVVYPGLPVKSVKELIALAKEKPGKLLCAASGVGVFSHLAGLLFQQMSGVDWVTVQFKGGATTMTDVIGGHSQITVNGIGSVLSYVKSGQVRALGVGGKKRSTSLPDVPTISEAGVRGYEADNFFGILAPAGTPKAIVDRLDKEIMTILDSPEVQKLLMAQGFEAAYMGSTEFGKFIEAETVKWTKVVKEAGIKIE